MRITRFAAENALSFEHLDCPVSPTLNVITGANAVGKSNLGRILEMVLGGLESCYVGNWDTFGALYSDAGRYNASQWTVRLGVDFEQELSTFDDWLRASLHAAVQGGTGSDPDGYRDVIEGAASLGTATVFARGELVLDYDRNRPQPWQVSWRSDSVTDSPTVTIRLESGNRFQLNGAPEVSPVTAVNRLFGKPPKGPGHERTPAVPAADLPDDFRLPSIEEVLSFGGLDLHVAPTRSTPEPASTQRLMAAAGINVVTSSRIIGVAEVAHKLMLQLIGVTANQRLRPERRFGSDHLTIKPDLFDGQMLALALYQDKNSTDARDRKRFAHTQELFRQLTSPDLTLEITARAFHDSMREAGEETLLTPIVSDAKGDVALHLSGAGRGEAAYLAAVLAREWSCLLLDEPATNLSKTAQGLVLDTVRERTRRGLQTLLITHSANLVPVENFDEVRSILRLSRDPGVTKVYRPDLGQGTDFPRSRLLHVREALFSVGVLLVEGSTDLDLCQVWFDQLSPTPTSANILILSVDTHTAFVPYMRLLDALGIPWCVLADGPAFKKELHRYDGAAPTDNFEAAKSYWQAKGVFTVAEEFGIDDRRGRGEIEEFMRRVDADALESAEREAARSKPQVGRLFAERVAVPDEFTLLWQEIIDRFASRACAAHPES